MNNRYKILIIEDEKHISNFIKADLESSNYQVFNAYTGNEGLLLFRSNMPDLILLDLGLPDCDGTDVIKIIRQESNLPIIVLSARSSEQDKVEALDLGVNDYVTKPFSTAELQARIRANLRIRFQQMSSVQGKKQYIADGLCIDFDERTIKVEGEEIRFTQTEYNIIALLAEHAGHMMTYQEIIKNIWNWEGEGSIKKLQVNMANIRKKLRSVSKDKQYIINELGVGYRIARGN